MDTPRAKSVFMVPALNSHNRNAKAARVAAARKQYAIANEKPALLSVVVAAEKQRGKPITSPEPKVTKYIDVLKATPTKSSAAKTRSQTALPTPPTDKKAASKLRRKVVCQTATLQPDNVNGKATFLELRVPVTSIVQKKSPVVQKSVPPRTPKTPNPQSKEAVIDAVGKKSRQQLLTPPPTPPMVLNPKTPVEMADTARPTKMTEVNLPLKVEESSKTPQKSGRVSDFTSIVRDNMFCEP